MAPPTSPKPPYGDVEYADSGLQADGKKRYPIDTPEHVRAALSYIAMPKNRKKYSSSQLHSIEAKIHAAAKKHGISGGTIYRQRAKGHLAKPGADGESPTQ